MKIHNDADLIACLKKGDTAALDRLYRMHAERVFNMSFLFLKDTGWSEDVVQEVFIKLWNNRTELDELGNLGTYLYVLTKRSSLNKLRDIKKFDPQFENLWSNISNLNDCNHEKLMAKELNTQLETILQKLPPRQKEIFILSRFEGFTHQEIADKLQISPNTVKNHMIAVLKTLRRNILPSDLVLFLTLSLI